MLINEMSTVPVRKEYAGSRFSGGPARFPQDTGAFPATKDTGDLHFPRKTSKVVGFHGDATELLGFHLSNYTSNSYPWPPL